MPEMDTLPYTIQEDISRMHDRYSDGIVTLHVHHPNCSLGDARMSVPVNLVLFYGRISPGDDLSLFLPFRRPLQRRRFRLTSLCEVDLYISKHINE